MNGIPELVNKLNTMCWYYISGNWEYKFCTTFCRYKPCMVVLNVHRTIYIRWSFNTTIHLLENKALLLDVVCRSFITHDTRVKQCCLLMIPLPDGQCNHLMHHAVTRVTVVTRVTPGWPTTRVTRIAGYHIIWKSGNLVTRIWSLCGNLVATLWRSFGNLTF